MLYHPHQPKGAPERLLVRQMAVVLIVFGIVLVAVAALIVLLTGRLVLALAGFGLFSLIAGGVQLARGKLWLPPGYNAANTGVPTAAEAADPRAESDCPACGHSAPATDGSQRRNGRDDADMRCAHCGNPYPSHRPDAA